MDSRTWVICLVSSLIALTGPAARAQTKVQRKPKFVFILIDDLGWRDLTCYGSTFYETPNIDRAAAQGMKFTSGYTCDPLAVNAEHFRTIYAHQLRIYRRTCISMATPSP